MSERGVTIDQWRAAVRFLLGLGTHPSLTASDQQLLTAYTQRQYHMTAEEARVVLKQLGWRIVTNSAALTTEPEGTATAA